MRSCLLWWKLKQVHLLSSLLRRVFLRLSRHGSLPCFLYFLPNRKTGCEYDEMIQERKRKMDYWWIIAVVVVWVVLQAYIFPKFGIST